MQADMVLEKKLRVLHLELAGSNRSLCPHWVWLSMGDLKAHPKCDCLQQVHTYSNKATPPNSATPYELMGANYIQTTTVGLNIE